MDLFDHHRQQKLAQTAPLADRMRPRTLDEFVGQGHIVGPGRLLRRAIQADQLSSLIFYGPPGTGKTTLARIIANTTNAHFISLNAVLSGVKDIRDSIDIARDKMGMFSQRTILFIDEVHRFNKAQQDALLPHVENGTVILIGATTENPYFEVNKALVSRSRIFQLKPLTEADLKGVAIQALRDPERGYGKRNIIIAAEALDHLVNVANGDARAVLNALELAVETSTPDETGAINLTTAVAEESIQKRAVLYDKDGDAHFDTISAFIKSVRGSDADAALYWLAKMVYAGEDPRFIFRRMIILAGEDVGLADPHALTVVMSAARAYDYVGMPEGQFHLAEACLYLATCPKSNSGMAFFDALATVRDEKEADVPDPLKDGNRDAEAMGHGAGYLYPHAYRDHWVAQQYLPTALQGKTFYQPSDQGYEASIRTQVLQRREAQLAAMLEPETDDPLTWGGKPAVSAGPRTDNRWLQRTLSTVGGQLGQRRDKLFALAHLQRHDLVLDLNAGTGLLTWEAVRRVPVGGVWALAADALTAEALQRQAQNLDLPARPVILTGDPADLAQLIAAQGQGAVRFDVLLGRNILTQTAHKADLPGQWRDLLAEGGRVALVESIPRRTQRLYKLVDLRGLGDDLAERLVQAEEAIYSNPADPMVNWGAADLARAFEQAGYTKVQVIEEEQAAELRLDVKQIEHWFDLSAKSERPSYAQHLLTRLVAEELAEVQTIFTRQLANQTVKWRTGLAYVLAKPS